MYCHHGADHMTAPIPSESDFREIARELAEAIDRLGTTLFGTETPWREAKATWWQDCVKAVDKFHDACGRDAKDHSEHTP